MNKEDLEVYVEETLKFKNISSAFNDFVYDFTIDELIGFLTDEMKEEILKTSPSYINYNDKWYFNGAFQDLQEEEIKEIIKKI